MDSLWIMLILAGFLMLLDMFNNACTWQEKLLIIVVFFVYVYLVSIILDKLSKKTNMTTTIDIPTITSPTNRGTITTEYGTFSETDVKGVYVNESIKAVYLDDTGMQNVPQVYDPGKCTMDSYAVYSRYGKENQGRYDPATRTIYKIVEDDIFAAEKNEETIHSETYKYKVINAYKNITSKGVVYWHGANWGPYIEGDKYDEVILPLLTDLAREQGITLEALVEQNQ